MRLSTPLLLLLLLLLAGCSPATTRVERADRHPTEENKVTETKATTPAAYDVYSADSELVLKIVDEPGPLYSTAPPPPTGAQVVRHPFLSATATSPLHEDKLRRILDQSTSTADYIAKLRAAGLRVEKTR